MGIFDVGSGADELEYDVVVKLFSSAYNAYGEGFCGGELKHLVDAVPVIEAHYPGAQGTSYTPGATSRLLSGCRAAATARLATRLASERVLAVAGGGM